MSAYGNEFGDLDETRRLESLYLNDVGVHYAVNSILALTRREEDRGSILRLTAILDAYAKRRVDAERDSIHADIIERLSRPRTTIPRFIG